MLPIWPNLKTRYDFVNFDLFQRQVAGRRGTELTDTGGVELVRLKCCESAWCRFYFQTTSGGYFFIYLSSINNVLSYFSSRWPTKHLPEYLSYNIKNIHGIDHFLPGHYGRVLYPPFPLPSFIVKKGHSQSHDCLTESRIWPLMARWQSLFHVW